MEKNFKTTTLELLSKIEIAIYDNIDNEKLKSQILNDLIETKNNIENIKIYSLLDNDPEVIEWNILEVEDLVYTFGNNIDDSANEELHKLILENINKLQIGNLESLHYQVGAYLDKEYVFKHCPEIIDFINNNQHE